MLSAFGGGTIQDGNKVVVNSVITLKVSLSGKEGAVQRRA